MDQFFGPAALAALRLQVEWGADEALAEAPVDRLRVRPPAVPAPQPPVLQSPVLRVPASRGPAGGAAGEAAALAATAPTREALREALGRLDCPLRLTATTTVFADGNPAAGLMLVGEAPGAEEDLAGLPFVGPSGRFLDRMLASIGLDRSRFLITNLIPWRPPGNRNPTDTEVVQCLPFLLRHIALVQPRHLVLVGGLATKAVTGTNLGITRVRGKWQPVTIPGLAQPVPALPMLHPAYLLRTPGAKREAWADLLTLRRALDGS